MIIWLENIVVDFYELGGTFYNHLARFPMISDQLPSGRNIITMEPK